MNWSDEGIVLSARRHGENSVIVQLLTRGYGRHAGLVRGGQGKRARGIYQPGNLVAARWSARLADHLGNSTCELVEIGAKVARHRRYVTFQLTEVAVPRGSFEIILRLIDDLRPRPAPA